MDVDAIRGLLWGGALGDSLGAPHEFRTGTPLRHYTGVLEFPLVRQNQWQGRRVGVVGQVSDDTEMMLALADALMSVRRYDSDRVAKAYMTWANSKCPFMGNNTRALFQGVKTLRGYQGRYQKIYGNAPQDAWSQSNGCLMRCAPLAALGAAALEAVKDDCSLTNPHPTCIDACQVYIRAARELGSGASPDEIADAAPEWAQVPAVRMTLVAAADAETGEREVTGTTKGWVLHALWCAFRALKVFEEFGTFEDTIDWVVRLDGDTDTNACIAGALLGAYLGYEAMVSEDRTGRNIATARDADPSQGALDRPAVYRASRIDRLAEGLHNVLNP